MTPRDDQVRIQHALDAARKAVSSTADWSREDLDPEALSTFGLIRLLEIIGEAASAVSSDAQAAHPAVPWRKMAGMRNRLIHGYFDVNLDVVWDTIQTDLPPLIEALERALS